MRAPLVTLAQQYIYEQLHTGKIVLSSIAVLLPGNAAKLAAAKLLSHHIVCGLDRPVHAILDMLLLFAGAWSGATLLSGTLGTFPNSYNSEDDNASSPLQLARLHCSCHLRVARRPMSNKSIVVPLGPTPCDCRFLHSLFSQQ